MASARGATPREPGRRGIQLTATRAARLRRLAVAPDGSAVSRRAGPITSPAPPTAPAFREASGADRTARGARAGRRAGSFRDEERTGAGRARLSFGEEKTPARSFGDKPGGTPRRPRGTSSGP